MYVCVYIDYNSKQIHKCTYMNTRIPVAHTVAAHSHTRSASASLLEIARTPTAVLRSVSTVVCKHILTYHIAILKTPPLHCYTCAQNFSILFPVTVGIILGHVCGSVKLMIVKKVKWLSRLATAHKSTVVAVNTHTDTYSHTLTHMQAWKSE